MLKKQADKLRKEQSKLANQFTEVPEVRNFSRPPLDAVALALFIAVIVLFFV